jgi:hypothetical protein
VFPIPDSYLAILTVKDNFNQTDTTYMWIIVTSPTNNPPTASPTATPSSGNVPLTVQFAANASDPDGDALTYAWDFGDGGTSTEENPVHVYQNAGAFVAWLTVSDGELEGWASVTIVIESGLYFQVSSASAKWTKNRSTIGNIHLEADVTPGMPGMNDLMAMYFDGITLFAAPFSSFVLTEDEYGPLYQFKDKNVLIKLDVATGWLWVISHKLNLADIDNANGVEVELHMGNAVAVENIAMTEAPGRKLIYKRQD